MVTILEADIDGVDMRGRGQGAYEIMARAEMGGIQRPPGEKAQRAFSAIDQILGTLNAGPAGLRDRIVQGRHCQPNSYCNCRSG
jgi:hypothetical protein